jgi:hypothetical protein
MWNPDQGDLGKFPLHDRAITRLAVIEASGNVIALEITRTADRANASRRPSWAKSDSTVEGENATLVDVGFVLGVVSLSAAKPPIYPQPECVCSGEAVAIADSVHKEGVDKQLKRRSCMLLGVCITVPSCCPRSSCRLDPGFTSSCGCGYGGEVGGVTHDL